MNTETKDVCDFTQLSTTANRLLVLKALEDAHARTPAEIQETINFNKAAGFGYSFLNKILAALTDEGMIERDKYHLYSITEKGAEHISLYMNKLQNICGLFENFKNISAGSDVSDPQDKSSAFKLYVNCPAVKFIPYSAAHLDTEKESDFFLSYLPSNGYLYEFDGRGLGTGNFQNYLAAFQNSNLVKFVAVIEDYSDTSKSGGIKAIKLKKESISKLTVPITARDIAANVDSSFRFVQNKQAFEDTKRVADFLTLLSFHL